MNAFGRWIGDQVRLVPVRHRVLLVVLLLACASDVTAPFGIWLLAFVGADWVRRDRIQPCVTAGGRLVPCLLALFRESRILLPGLVLTAAAALGAAIYNHTLSMALAVVLLLPIVLGASFLELVFRKEDALHLSHNLVWFALFVTAAGALLFTGVLPSSFEATRGRMASTFQNPNFLAFFLAMAILATLALRYHVWRPSDRLFLNVSLAVLGAGMFLTNSRSGLLALLAGIGVFLFSMAERRAILVLMGALTAGMVVLALFPEWAFGVLGDLLPRQESLGENVSQRVDALRFAWWEIRKNPFLGRGFYTFQSYIPSGYLPRLAHSHNLLANLWLETGPVGTAAFLVLTGRVVWAGFRSLRGSPIRPYLSAGLAMTGALFVHGLTDMPLMNPQVFCVFGLCLACASVAAGRPVHADRNMAYGKHGTNGE